MFKYYKIFLTAFTVITIGTVGYSLIEGWGILDSAYMTIITLATVGYGEIHPLSDLGRIFTLALILIGVGGFSLLVSYISQNVFSTFFYTTFQLKTMEKRIRKIKDHYIICGYGRIGKTVSNSLKTGNIPHVIISKQAFEMLEDYDNDVPYIQGDASHDEVLLRAGLLVARGLISVVHTEADNVFITLSARELNPKLYIISRFEEEATQAKLIRAGANRMINPYQIGSERISSMILQPTVSRILEQATRKGEFDLKIEEYQMTAKSELVGKTLKNSNIRNDFNVLVIAIDHGLAKTTFNPGPDYCIMASDRLVVMGNRKDMALLQKKFKLKV